MRFQGATHQCDRADGQLARAAQQRVDVAGDRAGVQPHDRLERRRQRVRHALEGVPSAVVGVESGGWGGVNRGCITLMASLTGGLLLLLTCGTMTTPTVIPARTSS